MSPKRTHYAAHLTGPIHRVTRPDNPRRGFTTDCGRDTRTLAVFPGPGIVTCPECVSRQTPERPHTMLAQETAR